MKRALLRVARTLGLFALSRWWTRDQLRILCYHGIWIGPPPHYGDRLFMSPERFEARLRLIGRLGYRVIGLDDAVQRHLQGRSRGRDLVITIDDAWLGTYLHMVPALERHGHPSTLYVTTYYVEAGLPVLNVLLGYLFSLRGGDALLGRLVPPDVPPAKRLAHLVQSVDALPTRQARWREVQRIAALLPDAPPIDEVARAFSLMNPEQLRDAARRGVDIQLHTHTHRMHGQDPARVSAEIELNRERLSELLGLPAGQFRHFCYPSGEHDPRVFGAVAAAGVVSATTTEFGLNPSQAHPMALSRILDGETLDELEFEAMVSGFWSIVAGTVAHVRGRRH